jgi:hypothetical protein
MPIQNARDRVPTSRSSRCQNVMPCGALAVASGRAVGVPLTLITSQVAVERRFGWSK